MSTVRRAGLHIPRSPLRTGRLQAIHRNTKERKLLAEQIFRKYGAGNLSHFSQVTRKNSRDDGALSYDQCHELVDMFKNPLKIAPMLVAEKRKARARGEVTGQDAFDLACNLIMNRLASGQKVS